MINKNSTKAQVKADITSQAFLIGDNIRYVWRGDFMVPVFQRVQKRGWGKEMMKKV